MNKLTTFLAGLALGIAGGMVLRRVVDKWRAKRTRFEMLEWANNARRAARELENC
ncbi:MAG: hypothetical protein L0332_24245 [Chloroflexi bacterium]|nr:hypothetical protein [Chloroflexota bacterium]MCI0648595.1 hypothetical protein [Chloroflexota bacterium]MCI0729806.1 hypothetical protein [Chloroflexota bacterium]